MALTIRAMAENDVPSALRLIRSAHPRQVLTEEAMRWSPGTPSRSETRTNLVAVSDDGTLAGLLRCLLTRDDGGTPQGLSYLASIAPEHLDSGVAALLLEAAERNFVSRGARTLLVGAADEAVQTGGDRFRQLAVESGYVLEESHQILELELARLSRDPAPPRLAEPVELRPLSSYRDDPRRIYEIDRLTTADEPGLRLEFTPYEEWLSGTWHHPLADLELSAVVLVSGAPAGIVCFTSDGQTRLESSMTGTLRRYRGFGLARHAKHSALLRAAELGFTHACTSNHADNAPMLSVNRRLGYEAVGSEGVYVKQM